MTGWQDISTAPRDGSQIVCWAPGWETPVYGLVWKTNRRITAAKAAGDKHAADMTDRYFGDFNEMDDYELAEPENRPTHWHPLEPLPALIATRKAAGGGEAEMSDVTKRLREKAASNGERGYVSIVLKIDECIALLDIAEAAQDLANGAITYPNIIDAEVQTVHLIALNAALARLAGLSSTK